MQPRRDSSELLAQALLVLAWLAVVVARALAPSDLMDNDQCLVAAYTTDIVANGDWIVQTDESGSVASKPPLYQWLAAAASLPVGRVTLLTLYLPGALAVLAMMLLTAHIGRAWFGPRIGMLAGLATLCSPAGVKMVWYARTDGLYSLLVFAGALAVFRAACTRRAGAWLLAWAILVVATMTKTPFAVPLAMFGLGAMLWGPRPARPADASATRSVILANLAGALLLIAVVGGWYLLARHTLGDAVREKLIEGELVRHAVGTLDDEYLGRGFLRQPFFYVTRLAPWSVLAIIAAVRAFTEPDADETTRLRTRFLLCFIAGGIFFVCFASRPRSEHLFPFIPATALLAAREVARLRIATPLWRWGLVGVCAVAIVLAQVDGRAAARTLPVRQTLAMRALAQRVPGLLRPDEALRHIESPYALQFFLGTMQVERPVDEVAREMREGLPIVAATDDPASLEAAVGAPLELVARWPEEGELAASGGVALVRRAAP